jgi:hypothetical protein
VSAPGAAGGNAAEAPGAAAPKADSGAKPGQPAEKQESAPVQQRQLVQTARIELGVKDDVFGAIVSARAIAITSGGFTGQEDSSGDKASITLRVPADKFDSAIEQLSKLGKVNSQHKQADDVTEQVVDLEARLATQRASVDRMRLLLGKAASVAEIAQIESELTRREADLESLQGRRDALGGKVALSTVVLTVSREYQASQPVEQKSDTGFLNGLDNGWSAFGTFADGVADTFGALLPFLVALGIPVGIWLYLRRRRRKTVVQAPVK